MMSTEPRRITRRQASVATGASQGASRSDAKPRPAKATKYLGELEQTYAAAKANHGFVERRFTGRYIVVFVDHSTTEAVTVLRKGSGLSVASSSDFGRRAVQMPGEPGAAVYLEKLGIAIASAPPDQLRNLGVSAANRLQIVPERYMFTAGTLQVDAAFLAGYRSGVSVLVDQLLADTDHRHGDSGGLSFSGVSAASADFTWNLVTTGVANSQRTGRGVKLAVLDTGFDQNHPDLRDRVALSASFVPGSTVQDVFGHGTHCLGTAVGLVKPQSDGPRYGCAGEAEILVGKVLGDDGHGDEGWVLNGINWALENDADIISLSIEGPYEPSSPVLPQYEVAGARALAAGRLIVAAAGNYSIRPLLTRPVASPACASTIMSVGAIGPDGLVASFSCAGGPGGAVDLAAPGVSIESSYPVPRTRKVDSGTSMAAPLVAGIAALYMESDAGLRGQALWDRLLATCRALPEGPSDVGAGCVTAP